MKLVIVESPYSGQVYRNVIYARSCLKDSFNRGECPFASHLIYTQVLDDNVEREREQGLAAGMAWAEKADLVAVYMDLGESKGMTYGIQRALEKGKPVVRRWIDGRQEEVRK